MMVRWVDWMYYDALARALDCIIFWHFREDGDYQPFLMPVGAGLRLN